MIRKYLILIMVLLGIGMLGYVNTEAMSDKGKDKDKGKSDDSKLSNHHTELSFTVGPNEPATFPLPKHDFPVQINVSTSNIPITYNGTTTNVGPLLINSVAAFDSGAGIGNQISGQCMVDNVICLASYHLPGGPSISHYIWLVLSIDKETGNMKVYLQINRPDFILAASQITYNISMWY